MNRKQREKNRENARRLAYFAIVCPECGERGKHWVTGLQTFSALFGCGAPAGGFWTCAKFYGPDGRRLDA